MVLRSKEKVYIVNSKNYNLRDINHIRSIIMKTGFDSIPRQEGGGYVRLT